MQAAGIDQVRKERKDAGKYCGWEAPPQIHIHYH